MSSADDKPLDPAILEIVRALARRAARRDHKALQAALRTMADGGGFGPAPSVARLARVELCPEGYRLVFNLDGEQIWRGVSLRAWINGGSEVLRPLLDQKLFASGRMSELRDAVEWGDAGSDLAIDAERLARLTE